MNTLYWNLSTSFTLSSIKILNFLAFQNNFFFHFFNKNPSLKFWKLFSYCIPSFIFHSSNFLGLLCFNVFGKYFHYKMAHCLRLGEINWSFHTDHIKLKFQFDVQTDKHPQNEALNVMKIDSHKNYALKRDWKMVWGIE